MTTNDDISLLFEQDGVLDEFDASNTREELPIQTDSQDEINQLDELATLLEDDQTDAAETEQSKAKQVDQSVKSGNEKDQLLKTRINSFEENAETNSSQNQATPAKRSFKDAFGAKFSDSKNNSEQNCEAISPSETKKSPEIQPAAKKKCFYSTQSPRIAKASAGNFGSLSAAPMAGPKKVVKGPSIEMERYSRIRMKQSFVSAAEMQQRMESKTFLKLSLIRPTLKLANETDWVTVAVVAKQLDPQTAKNGKPFSIWHLTDLDDCTKHVSIFLFGQVHQELWKKITVGHVIGLLNPSIMPPKREESNKSYDNIPALTVDVSDRVMKIGVSADLGWCMATKYRNKQPVGKCLAFINKQFGETCVYHMQSKFKKVSSKRGELQGSVAPPIADKYKKTLWNKVRGDQFFYGGQVFSAAPPSSNPNIQQKQSKMKLTSVLEKAKSMSTLKQKEQLERSKIMQALSGIKGEKTVSGCSDAFSEMLSSGDMVAGSRQFLNHLHKKEKKHDQEETKSVPISPLAVLKEQHSMIRGRLVSAKPPTINFVSADTIKKCTQDLITKRKNANPSGRNANLTNKLTLPAPKLLKNSSNENGVDIFGNLMAKKSHVSCSSITLAEIQKKKAAAKLRNDKGDVEIKKVNPNQTVIGRINDVKENKKLQEKFLSKVNRNRKDKENENVEKNDKKKKISPALGQKLSEDEFARILNASSSHSVELKVAEMEQQDEYFKPLIKKEMMEQKMSETFEVPAKVATCNQCNYTFWAPHERCKQLQHTLVWKNVKKRFFACTQCKQRTTCWEPYPAKSCRDCGMSNKWKRTCMLKAKDIKLDSEILLIRGLEHSQFLNALK